MVLGLIGNIAGNLDQEAFVQGAENQSRLQALQRSNQQRINEAAFLENAKAPEIQPIESVTQGMAGLNLDRFGGNFIEIDPVDNNITGPELDLPNAPGGKPIPKVDKGSDPDKDGVEQQDGSLEQKDNVELNPASNLKYPVIDPDKIALPPAGMGPQYDEMRRKETLRRRDIDGKIRSFGLRRVIGSQKTMKMSNFYGSDDFKNFIYQHPQFLDEIEKDP